MSPLDAYSSLVAFARFALRLVIATKRSQALFYLPHFGVSDQGELGASEMIGVDVRLRKSPVIDGPNSSVAIELLSKVAFLMVRKSAAYSARSHARQGRTSCRLEAAEAA